MSDPYDLQRFVDAQRGVYEAVLEELRAGQKRSHWMWFIFPQIAGLGHSEMARHYALSSLDEARAYLAHPVLGARLRECCQILAGLPGGDAERVFGYPDHMKLHSSMTLFAQAAKDDPLFTGCLCKYFDGLPDPATLARL